MEKLSFDEKLNQATRTNYITFSQYFDWLQNLATNVFEWENLPPQIPQHYIEHTLFQRGRALFFKDETLGYLCLPASGNGTKNVYWEDVAFQINAPGYHWTRDISNSVLIWNNNTKSPTADIVMSFAARLANTERITDTNMNAQKTPVLLVGEEKSILTLKNIYKKYQGNEPVIFGDKNFISDNPIRAISTLAPFIVDKMDIHKQNVWNEALTFLGIKNANTDKRERLITAEVDANDEQINSNLEVMLEARNRACKDINKMFGLNISVRVRGGEEDEPVHDRTTVSDPAEL